MRKLAFLAILILSMIAFVSTQKMSGQVQEMPDLQKRISIFESDLKQNNRAYKYLGENKCKSGGKIVQKITTGESFEIVALPMIENSQAAIYTRDFKGTLYAENGFKLSEAESKYGIRLAAKIFDATEARMHKFEFLNPNATPVNVRFYYVQAETN